MDSFFTFKWKKLVGCSGSDLRGSVPDPVAYIQYMCAQLHSRVQLFATLWTVAHQAPLSTGSSKQDSGVGSHSLLQGIFSTRCRTRVSCTVGRLFTILSLQGSPYRS